MLGRTGIRAAAQVKALSRSFAFLPMNSICRFSEEEKQLQSMVRTFSKKHIDPIAAKVDKDDWFPRELWPQLGELGLLGITAPSAYGGSELNYTAQCIAIEEISRSSGSIALSYLAHSNLCVNQITRYGTDAQKKKFLPKLCTGEWVGALAMSEPNSGSDVTSMKTRAEKKGDKYIINGSKIWITNGSEADVLVLYAKTDIEKKDKGITAFIVDTKSKGFKVAQKLDKLGMRGSPTAELVFENLEVPAENVLGEGVYVLMSGLDYERLILSAGPVGLMQAALDITVDYCKQREQFGKKIGEFQLMQGKMSDMYMKLQSSRAFLYSLARNADEGITSNTDCASVFTHTAEASVEVALEAIQALGGNGYTNDYPVGRILRDAKLYSIGGGTNEIRRWLVGREIMKNYQTSC